MRDAILVVLSLVLHIAFVACLALAPSACGAVRKDVARAERAAACVEGDRASLVDKLGSAAGARDVVNHLTIGELVCAVEALTASPPTSSPAAPPPAAGGS